MSLTIIIFLVATNQFFDILRTILTKMMMTTTLLAKIPEVSNVFPSSFSSYSVVLCWPYMYLLVEALLDAKC